MLGDSQETCPGGFGEVYVPRFNWELWQRYGNAPSTPWTTMRASYGGSPPWGPWLLRAGFAPPSLTETRVAARRLPPGFSGGKTSTRGGINVNNNQEFGQLLMLQHDSAASSPETGIGGVASYFPGGSCSIDVIAATGPSSGEVSVWVTSAPTAEPSFFETIQSVLFSSMDLEDLEVDIRSQRLGPVPMTPGRYLQAEFSGTDPAKFTDIIAARFVSESNSRGLTVTPIAEGGYSSSTILESHAGCFQVLEAMKPDVVFLCYGANDVGAYYTPEIYRSFVELLIAKLRREISSTLPVILISDPARGQLNEYGQGLYDRYAGANYLFARADPLVCALNSRLLTEQAGWTARNIPRFTDPSLVHYNALGATLKARVEIDALFREFVGCFADFNDDGIIDLFDYIDFLACFESETCPPGRQADVNNDGFVDFFDLDAFVTAFLNNCAP